MIEVFELACACCECTLGLIDLASQASAKKAASAAAGGSDEPPGAIRTRREERRGVRLQFTRRRITEIEFLSGPAAGKLASQLADRELLRLYAETKNRTARFAIRRFIRNRKSGRAAPPAVQR